MSTDVPDWARLPVKLQHEFFDLANDEAKRTKTLLLVQKKKLEEIGHLLRFRKVPTDDSWRKWRIAVVDGSDSPAMSERVGGRFGAYAAGYQVYQNLNLVEEDYYSGYMADDQVGSSDVSKDVLDLLTTELERIVALKCLKRTDVDLVIIDGPFFGFRLNCNAAVKRKELEVPVTRLGSDLIENLTDMSTILLNSAKAVGVVKRVRTAAIDGCMIHKSGSRTAATGRNDKDILASFMRSGDYLSLTELFGSFDAYNYLSRLAGRSRSKHWMDVGIESLYKLCVEDVKSSIKRILNRDVTPLLDNERYFLRCDYPAPPFAFEVKTGMNVDPILAFFQACCNKATGLPIILDLIDEAVTVPRGFVGEFVEEIEATLARDAELDKYELETRFSSLNPQKQE